MERVNLCTIERKTEISNTKKQSSQFKDHNHQKLSFSPVNRESVRNLSNYTVKEVYLAVPDGILFTLKRNNGQNSNCLHESLPNHLKCAVVY